jgi:hypothetical protein
MIADPIDLGLDLRIRVLNTEVVREILPTGITVADPGARSRGDDLGVNQRWMVEAWMDRNESDTKCYDTTTLPYHIRFRTGTGVYIVR